MKGDEAGLRPEEISLRHERAIKRFISPTKVLKLPAEVLRVLPTRNTA